MRTTPTTRTVTGIRRGFLLLLILGASGCGLAYGGVGQVTGTVTFKGKPLTSGDVLFVSEDGKKHWAVLGPQGVYTIKNVPTGLAKIAVVPRSRVPDGLMGTPGKGRAGKPRPANPYTDIPARYKSPEKSGLTYTVEPGRQTFDIPLKP
jgi:hypothetical protein